jgi:hypothetical protein
MGEGISPPEVGSQLYDRNVLDELHFWGLAHRKKVIGKYLFVGFLSD